MYLDFAKIKSTSGKIHQRILLRESYRENGKVKKKTLANLSALPLPIINSINFQLGKKSKIPNRISIDPAKVIVPAGLKFGGVFVLHQIAKRLKITEALDQGRNGKLISWLIYSRLLFQGSRLMAARLSKRYAVKSVLDLDSFSEDHLYEAMDWLAENQKEIEDKLNLVKEKIAGGLFLYDVTSCYFEGEQNALADYGYNRDGKKGKKQIVIGLLTDGNGEPLSIEVFRGNTADPKTCSARIKEIKKQFGSKMITLVGDRGMIKGSQIEAVINQGWNYITAITKSQIEKLLRTGVFQLELFDEDVQEIIDQGVRYVVRRNPLRAEELQETRLNKIKKLQEMAIDKTVYLANHIRAKEGTAQKYFYKQAEKLKIKDLIEIKISNRIVTISANKENMEEEKKLDGCYVIKTNITDAEKLTAQEVHDRYCDLTQVEWAFRTMKTTFLENRPIYHRKESRTRAVCFISMLAYKIAREISKSLSPRTKELIKLISVNEKEISNQVFPLKDILSEMDMLQETFWKTENLSLPIILAPSKIGEKILSILKIKLPVSKPA